MPGVVDITHSERRTLGGRLTLAPFRAVRYSPDKIDDLGAVTSPPYDLIDDADIRRLMAAEPHNVVRLILPRHGARDRGERYAGAARTLRRWQAEAVLVTDAAPALYVYEQRSAEYTQRGLVGGLGMVPPEDGAVLPHEDVLPGPVADRLALMRATEANLEPILCLYDGAGPASRLVEGAVADGPAACEVVAEDGVAHRLWPITDRHSHDVVDRDLRDRRALIADGHHRYATYLRLQGEYHAAGHGPGPWDYGLAMLVDATRYPPRLGAIHRVVAGLRPDEAVRRARRVCRVVEAPKDLGAAVAALADAARAGPAFLLAGNGRQHLVTDPDPSSLAEAMPEERSPRWRRLATAVLHTWLVPQIWGIDDPAAVRVVHDDAAAAVESAARHRGTAVLLDPLAVDDVFALAAEGERVPHKSTSFGPKPRTGLVLRTFAAG